MHSHHITPKHIGGTDDPSNLIMLTVSEHAEAHKKLYEESGRWEDKIAWQGLSGMIGHDEIIREKQSLGGKNVLGYKRTLENRANISAGKIGIKKGPSANMSLAKTGNSYALGYKHQIEQCPHCNKAGSGGVMKRWHFDNCKEINT